jgi:hypothetical protein
VAIRKNTRFRSGGYSDHETAAAAMTKETQCMQSGLNRPLFQFLHFYMRADMLWSWRNF